MTIRDQIAAWPAEPKASDYEYTSTAQDPYGNVYPLVGYQYKAGWEYDEAQIKAIKARLATATEALRACADRLEIVMKHSEDLVAHMEARAVLDALDK